MPRFTPHLEETKQKIREAHIGKKMGKDFARKCRKRMLGKTGENTPNWQGGLPKCIDCGIERSNYRKAERCKSCSGKRLGKLKMGKNHPNWKGGRVGILQKIRALPKYNEWRKSVYDRDRYICVICNDSTGGNLEADHIIRLADIVEYFCIKTMEDAKNCSKLWSIDNGRTLCKDCHRKTDTYGWRGQKNDVRFKQLFNYLKI